MSEVSEAIQAKCLAFGDRIIKLNDFPELVKLLVHRCKKIDEQLKEKKK